MTVKVSVVVATFNRLPLLLDLLKDLEAQSIPKNQFEVVVVDDGSHTPAKQRLHAYTPPYRFTLIEQQNAGPAAARHNGIIKAEGELIVILDDDMHIGPDFLAAHLDEHAHGASVVQGHIAAPPQIAGMPLFERFHAHQLERFVRNVASGKESVRGIHICTGNLSFRKDQYLAIGGFDQTLGRSEDRELGIRLEKAGATLVLSTKARSAHRSDHEKLDVWLRRAFNYGVYDLRIAKKHPDLEIADPWRFVWLVNPISRPLLLLAAAAPGPTKHLSTLAHKAASVADQRGLARVALAGVTLTYGLEYFRGVRREASSLAETAKDFLAYANKRKGTAQRRPTAKHVFKRFVDDVRADYQTLIRTRAKYNHDIIDFNRLPVDVVTRIGLQMMVATRLMRLLRDLGVPLAPKVASRLIRHLYSAEIHWDAEFSPGVMLIHGTGLVISHAAHVGEDCILFHNVTLGEGIDPVTRVVGSPTLEANVHVGPGATLLGPIRIGEGSKIMAGAVVTRSVPSQSLVRPSDAVVTSRTKRTGEVRNLRGAANEALSFEAANDDSTKLNPLDQEQKPAS